jgi:hypothetical protein
MTSEEGDGKGLFPLLLGKLSAELPDFFLEIPHKKSINSPFTSSGILKFPKYLKET